MLAGIVGIIAGMLAGSGGLALIASGPVGWVIGAVVACGAVFGFRGQIKEKVRTYAFEGLSLRFLHQVVNEKELNKKFDEAEATLSSSLSEKIGQDIEANKKDLIC
jgi:hypothetical protein